MLWLSFIFFIFFVVWLCLRPRDLIFCCSLALPQCFPSNSGTEVFWLATSLRAWWSWRWGSCKRTPLRLLADFFEKMVTAKYSAGNGGIVFQQNAPLCSQMFWVSPLTFTEQSHLGAAGGPLQRLCGDCGQQLGWVFVT